MLSLPYSVLQVYKPTQIQAVIWYLLSNKPVYEYDTN